jgi:hypothetical protein
MPIFLSVVALFVSLIAVGVSAGARRRRPSEIELDLEWQDLEWRREQLQREEIDLETTRRQLRRLPGRG